MEIENINPGGDLTKARAVRTAVFITEQKFDAENEFDEIDPTAYHVVVYGDSGSPMGTGRLFPSDEIDGEYIVGRVAVLKEARGKGIGREVMLALERKAKTLDANSLYLGAQDHAVKFYEGVGYSVVGEEYMDEHTPHYPMRKDL